MAKVELKLSDDRRGLDLTGTQDTVTFSAVEVDDLIRILSGIRAAMVPAIPNGAPASGTQAATAPNMTWYVRVDPALITQCQLWLLHPGLGWMAIPLPKSRLSRLMLALQQAHDAMPEIQ